MKKTYATPSLTCSGKVVRETLGDVPSGNETAFQPLSAGSLGFNL